MNLTVLIIVGIFFLVTFLIGVIDRKKVTIQDYWVNGRRTNKFILIATVSSTYLGVGAIISNAGVTYSGAGLAALVIMASFFLYFLIFARWFAPKIKEFGDLHQAYTLPDFLEVRYSKNVRIAGLLVNLLSYSFFLALQILGFGIFVSEIGGINPSLAILIGGLIVVGYTSIGGLRADIRTDVFQFIIMLSLLFVFLPWIIVKGGGFDSLSSLPGSFLVGKEFAKPYVYLLAFLFLGATNLTSADLWQRVYAGDTKRNVRFAMNVAAIVTFLFMIMGTLFGLYGKALLPEVTPNTVIPSLLQLYLPPFALGIVLAGFFAAIMSSADTVLLILSMTCVHDFYQKTLGKTLSEEQTLRISRWTTFILGGLGIAIAIVIFNVVDLVIDAISFPVVLLPAIIFGFYSKRATSKAAFWSIILGMATLIIFLFIAPVEAFIPALIVSFLSFFIINHFTR